MLNISSSYLTQKQCVIVSREGLGRYRFLLNYGAHWVIFDPLISLSWTSQRIVVRIKWKLFPTFAYSCLELFEEGHILNSLLFFLSKQYNLVKMAILHIFRWIVPSATQHCGDILFLERYRLKHCYLHSPTKFYE